MAQAGYSGRSLADKLGVKAGMRVVAIGAPREYASWVAPLPDGAKIVRTVGSDPVAVHIFATKKADLAKHLHDLRNVIAQDSMVWVSWPKKTSGVATNITEDTIRGVALPMGYVDIKVCGVTEVWSGLKLVIRKSKRTTK